MRKISEATVPSLDIDTIVSVLSESPVTVAVLYGSHARDEATDRSDIDLAVAFEETLSSIDRTRARLALIERLSVELETDDIDVVPLSRTPPDLLREVRADGIVLCGSKESVPRVSNTESKVEAETHEDRLAQFDELLTDIRRVV